jgi:dolichyl-phosphate-mannose-protein mannosyltransferase
MGRQLFLHHYLPASIFAYMMVGVLFEFCVMESVQWPTSPGITLNKDQAQHTTRQAGWWSWLVWLVVLVCQVLVFLWLSEMTFGDGTLTPEEWKQRKLLSSWDLMD